MTDLKPAARSLRDRIRWINKHYVNPVMLRLAGRRHWYAAVIHHRGRSTGRDYATPVVAEPVPGGFVVPLPYGTGVDWLRNVLTAGVATLDVKGRRYQVDRPEVVELADVLPLVDPVTRVFWQVYRFPKCLRLSVAPVT